MGLTERHLFENEDVPENYEWALEDAVYNSRTNKKADMVEVVRCKDCKWFSEKGFCKHPDGGAGNIRPENWFCADGEEREAE